MSIELMDFLNNRDGLTDGRTDGRTWVGVEMLSHLKNSPRGFIKLIPVANSYFLKICLDREEQTLF